jgi:hypothetical protein
MVRAAARCRSGLPPVLSLITPSPNAGTGTVSLRCSPPGKSA